MKKTGLRLMCATVAWLIAGPAMAMTASLASGSKVWLEGDSTLHPFKSEASQVELALDLPGAAPLQAAVQSQGQATMTVRIPVASLKSEHKGLDENLQKALNAKKFPDIVYVMSGFHIVKDGDDEVVTTGDLTIAGVTKHEGLEAKLSWKDGRAVVDGAQVLLMTDFGVTPPTMMMGAIKTKDKIVVRFHLELEASGETKGTLK